MQMCSYHRGFFFFVTGDVQFGLGAGSKGGLLYRDNQELLNMSSEP